MDQAAEETGNKTALIFEEKTLTYRELADRIDVLAVSLLELGVKHGDRVVVLLPNCPDLIIASQAILKIGAIKVPFYIGILAEDLIGGLRYSEAKAIIMTSEWKGRSFAKTLDKKRHELSNLRFVIVMGQTLADMIPLHQLVNHDLDQRDVLETYLRENIVEPHDLACVEYSRGIGTVKNTVHTHRSVYSIACSGDAASKIRENDVWLDMVPLSSTLGFQCLEPCALAGKSTLVLMERFDVLKALTLIEKYSVTILVGVPSIFTSMFESSYFDEFDVSSVRLVYLGGPVVPQHLPRNIKEKLRCQLVVV